MDLKTTRGAKGQVKVFEECLARLYPNSKDVNPHNILQKLKQYNESRFETEFENFFSKQDNSVIGAENQELDMTIESSSFFEM